MSIQKYYEKVERQIYICNSCNKPLPETTSDKEWFAITWNGKRLDFHKSCIWEHLLETWIPYDN